MHDYFLKAKFYYNYFCKKRIQKKFTRSNTKKGTLKLNNNNDNNDKEKDKGGKKSSN